jgi:hypothetical protein
MKNYFNITCKGSFFKLLFYKIPPSDPNVVEVKFLTIINPQN